MGWYHDVSYFFGGIFLANAFPHYLAGVSGSPFQSPFASPPGEGLSSATVNVAWGLLNLFVAYLLLARVGDFQLRRWRNFAAVFAGILAISFSSAHHFGRFHGGAL
jgi:hypothetical protein